MSAWWAISYWIRRLAAAFGDRRPEVPARPDL